MWKMQLTTKQTNETILQSVSWQLQGMNTTIEKWKLRMKIIIEEWTKNSPQWNMLEDPHRRRNDTKANGMEGNNSQEDQNQRRAVVTGFHDDTTAQEVQDTLKEVIMTIGKMSNKTDHTCILAIQRHR